MNTTKILSLDFDATTIANPAFAAARGAALSSRQRQERPPGCEEDEKRCGEERRREKEKIKVIEGNVAIDRVKIELR